MGVLTGASVSGVWVGLSGTSTGGSTAYGVVGQALGGGGSAAGVVGKIGSILGRHNVNIASMHVGRRTRRGRAIVVLLLDDDVPAEVMEEVSKSVEADFARVIRL